MNKYPLLSISIPTYNRALFLEKTLLQLYQEIQLYGLINKLEIIVSDNSSSDGTPEIVKAAINYGLSIAYHKNTTNIGSDANIAQAFNLASGKYVLILGDDDLLVNGALDKLIKYLETDLYGIVSLKAFGYDRDFNKERPSIIREPLVYKDPGKFLVSLGAQITLISACVINKSLIPCVNASNFCGSHLVQVNLVILAALASSKNMATQEYLIACKRNNSGGYNLAKVFACNLGDILDSYKSKGITEESIVKLEHKLIISYFPYYIFKALIRDKKLVHDYQVFFDKRYSRYCLFKWWLKPSLSLPYFFALPWALLTTILGRIIFGDFVRAIHFLLNKISPSNA